MKDIMFVTATEKRSYEDIGGKCTDFYDTLVDTRMENNVVIEYGNRVGLGEVYNRYISDNYRDFIVVFMHDDAVIEDLFWKEKLLQYSKHYDVMGLAGTAGPIRLNEPPAWHLMSDRGSLRGAVAHRSEDNHWMSAFGPSPSRVLLIDGVFMAVNVASLLDNGVKFDPQFAFHHYDLDFSLTCNQHQVKVGVIPLWITHYGLGDSMNSDAWRESSKLFVNKWSKYVSPPR